MKLYGKHTHEVANRIVEAFRHPEKLPKALAPIFIHRKDDIPCRKWSWHNQLIVALHGTMDARGINQWRTANRHLKKGCKAIWILAPCLRTIKKGGDDDTEKGRQVLYGFRSVPVFAMEDTEGEAIPESDDKYGEWVEQLPLLEVAKAWSITLGTYSHHGGDPLGYYQYGSNGNKAIMLGVENLSTWTHELTHAADHRLGGLKEAKWHKEIVAELGSSVLLECLGHSHDADFGGAYEYIESYAASAKKPVVKACTEVLDRACNCVKLILDTAASLQPEGSPTS